MIFSHQNHFFNPESSHSPWFEYVQLDKSVSEPETLLKCSIISAKSNKLQCDKFSRGKLHQFFIRSVCYFATHYGVRSFTYEICFNSNNKNSCAIEKFSSVSKTDTQMYVWRSIPYMRMSCIWSAQSERYTRTHTAIPRTHARTYTLVSKMYYT